MTTRGIWVVEDSNGFIKAFDTLEKAYNYTRETVLTEYQCHDDEDVIAELDRNLADDKFAGFYIDEICWCWQVDFEEG